MLRSLIVLTAISAIPVCADLVAPTKPLEALIAEADLIVIGSFASNYAAPGPVDGELIAEKAFKGVLPSSRIKIRWTGSPRRPNAIPRNRGLVFLKKQDPWLVLPILSSPDFGTSGWIPLPANNPAIPALPSETPKLRILVQLAHAARQSRDYRGYMQLETLCRSSPEARTNANVAAALRSSGELGEGCLIGHGDIGPVLALERREQQSTPGFSIERDYLLRQLRFYYGNQDRRGIAALGRLALNPATRSDVRQAAATALARIHSLPALPHLAALLDQSDPFLQAIAAGGLSSFANKIVPDRGQVPGDRNYRTSQTIRYADSSLDVVATDPRYLAFWREWWRQHRAELTPP